MTSQCISYNCGVETTARLAYESLKRVRAFVLVSGFMYYSVGFTCNCTSRIFSHAKDECSFLYQPSRIWPTFLMPLYRKGACIHYKYLKLEPTVRETARVRRRLSFKLQYLDKQAQFVKLFSPFKTDERSFPFFPLLSPFNVSLCWVL